MRQSFHLPINFVLQSYLICRIGVSLTVRRQCRTIIVLLLIAAVGLVVATQAHNTSHLALGLGMMAPGAGFSVPIFVESSVIGPAFAMSTAVMAFVLALILWFGTGNVLAPVVVWIGSAFAAVLFAGGKVIAPIDFAALLPVAGSMPALVVLALVVTRGGRPSKVTFPASVMIAAPRTGELDMSALQLQRLLLDRALQPVDQFEGFEWRDQFQTAAVRYQVNFLSYALSLSHAHYLPAFSGYILEAQQRLLAKQSDRRMWRYWALESLWGHLRRSADPVSRDNIMYSGFVAAQIAYAEAAGGRSIAQDSHLDLRIGNHRLHYNLSALVAILAKQYRASPWGLLACEPHWVYPLCNQITATAIRAADARSGHANWTTIAPKFRDSLLTEFTTNDGQLIPFKSSLTGMAMPMAGGIVMQAFPCCPQHCDFCYKDAFFTGGRSFYAQRVDEALAEIERLPGRHLYFLDDHLLGDRRFGEGLFEGMRGMGRLFQGAATVDSVLRGDLIDRAAEAGLRSLFVGFETFSPQNLAASNKKQNLAKDYAAVTRRLSNLGIMINGSFVFGMNDDGPDVFARTVDWAVEHGITTATFHIQTPYPGTRLYQAMAAQGRLTSHNWDDYDTRHVVFQSAKLTSETLKTGYDRAYRDFYRWRNIAVGSLSHDSLKHQAKRFFYAAGWKKFEPLWDMVIKARRLGIMTPLLEGILSRVSRDESVSGIQRRTPPDLSSVAAGAEGMQS